MELVLTQSRDEFAGINIDLVKLAQAVLEFRYKRLLVLIFNWRND